MIRLAHVIERFEAEFLAQYGQRLSAQHLQALAAMRGCRTQASLKIALQCPQCDTRSLVPHSCGHRHCPHCQHHESQAWLERQLQRQVPAPYFLLTFTLPAELRALAWAHQDTLYELLIGCAWQCVRRFARHDRALQGTPGAIAVLHTHSRRLEFHPHVHLIVPAAAIDRKKKRWRTKRRGPCGTRYLFSHKALAKVFRAKMLAGIAAAGLALPARSPQSWVVDCKSVGSGEKALIYLGRYLYRGVIREQDILACGEGQVRFRYRDARTGRLERRTVPGAQFLWLVLQHVLPKGFRRARNFGFLHPNSKRLIALLQVLLRFAPLPMPVRARAPVHCPRCQAPMRIVRTRIRPAFAEPPPIAAAAGAASM